MKSILTATFWLDSFERAVKTAAQAALGLWAVGDQAFNALTVDWKAALIAAGSGAVLSILTSIISAPLSSDNTASLVA